MTTKTRFVRLGLMVLGMIALVAVLSLVQLPMRAVHMADVFAWPILIAVSLATYAAWVRLVERRRVDELAPSAALPEGGFGLAIGLVLFALTMTLLALAGAYRFGGFNSWSPLAVGIADAVGAAVFEEVLFRGFLFRVVREVGGTWIAVAVSAVVFGAFHVFNPGASVLSTIAIALEAGVLLALAYAATNRLWLPIGLHAGWNFAEGTIFGTSVSGHAATPSLLRGVLQGPAALTGGSFGPEASFVAILVCVAASAAFAVVVIRRERALGSAASYRSRQSTGT